MNNKPDILMAIQPGSCRKIFNKLKTKELRKVFPNLEPPFRVYVYCTNSKDSYFLQYCENKLEEIKSKAFIKKDNAEILGDKILNGKVIGSFICDGYEKLYATPDCERIINELCLTNEEIKEYLDGGDGCAWNITEPKLYVKPKELGEFRAVCTNLNHFDNLVCHKCDGYDPKTREYPSNCSYNGYRSLTRPPKSYMYVEPLEIE